MLAHHVALGQAVAERLFIHGMLRSQAEIGRAAARRERLVRLRTRLEEEARRPKSTRLLPLPRDTGLRPALALAAALLLAAGLSFFLRPEPGRSLPALPEAHAMVLKAEADAQKDVDRRYLCRSFVNSELTPRRTWTLYVRGSARFAGESLTLRGRQWFGCDGKLLWRVPPHGPVLVSRDLSRLERRMGHSLDETEDEPPFLSVARVIGRLKAAFALETVGRETLAGFPHRQFVHVRATRPAGGEPSSGWLKRAEVWIDEPTGTVVRLQVFFAGALAGQPRQFRVELEQAPQEPLPEDFYHHSAHGSSSRHIIDTDQVRERWKRRSRTE